LLESKTVALLQTANLDGRPYTLDDFVAGMRRAYPQVRFEQFDPVGNLRGGLFRSGETVVIFYPAPSSNTLFASLQALGHEIGHLMLGHHLHEAPADGRHRPDQEVEAEAVAMIIVRRRSLSGDARSKHVELDGYFGALGRG